MFLGHIGVALAAKKVAPKTSLGTLFFATELADLLWPIFLLVGWEQVRVAPEITRVTPLDFISYPLSHSLVAQVIWAVALGLVYFATRGSARAAWIVGGCVVSHWFLDFVSHRPDMPVFPHGPYVGLGLWYSLPATMVVELGLLGLGVGLYLQTTRTNDSIGRFGFWSLILLLIALWIFTLFGPPPPDNARVIALSGLGLWLVVVWAGWVDHHRSLAPARA